MAGFAALALVLVVISINLTGQCHAALQIGFYDRKCGLNNVESIVTQEVTKKFIKDRTIAAALIRMYFHDCFVKLSVRGYDVIDAAKDAVEAACPGVVSCADIIAMATRDAVSLSRGGRYNVETGRRDGLESLASNVVLPSPQMTVSQSVSVFAKKGFSPKDMVYLLGGHTVGFAHCVFFQDRLYNFQNTGKPDPTMNSTLLQALRFMCPQNSLRNNAVNLDQNPSSSFTVDNSFYKQILLNRGILQIDQELALDSITKDIVKGIATSNDFITKFAEAMVKLGRTEVLTDTQGEIRRSCRSVNNNNNNSNNSFLTKIFP
ncbi:peroxidase 60 [Carica papaya]|uniref:peroxidase 60 n=1 Tax=Carica papaya TaxID=3649 RepID=UPI000B8CAD8F|nr:peroxidase 60 [Carica papaya]